MKTNGWLEDYWVKSDGERQRKYYRITPAGEEQLEVEKAQWMTVHTVLQDLWNTQTT